MIYKTSRWPVVYLNVQVWETWGNSRNYECKIGFLTTKGNGRDGTEVVPLKMGTI